ncbi:UpxZ family transcription anti-terminator antagonist [Bacteroides sp. 51]|uniref:UpxZ family transcription anti-terminator antagonist n=1 Tax=Bacteroides sp. 51 TaxID=2302938 RepID=UPI0013CF539B|nr:UpxZ family transcription anti-terminator antagonist [Bacteroides sp. 51]NDV81539.1 transcriptional regulator [Bacteroides sp. 51]
MKIANELYQSAHLLLHLGEDGSPIYADKFRQLNTEVTRLLNELYPVKGSSNEEEAEICLALLMGFSSAIYSVEGQEEKVQVVLDRAYAVLQELELSLLKCRLLLCCYAETRDKELMLEAKEVILSWGGRELTEEENRVMGMYNDLMRL